MKTETAAKAILTELRAITKDKAKWQTAIAEERKESIENRYFLLGFLWGEKMMWAAFALLSAVFAALTSYL